MNNNFTTSTRRRASVCESRRFGRPPNLIKHRRHWHYSMRHSRDADPSQHRELAHTTFWELVTCDPDGRVHAPIQPWRPSNPSMTIGILDRYPYLHRRLHCTFPDWNHPGFPNDRDVDAVHSCAETNVAWVTGPAGTSTTSRLYSHMPHAPSTTSLISDSSSPSCTTPPPRWYTATVSPP